MSDRTNEQAIARAVFAAMQRIRGEWGEATTASGIRGAAKRIASKIEAGTDPVTAVDEVLVEYNGPDNDFSIYEIGGAVMMCMHFLARVGRMDAVRKRHSDIESLGLHLQAVQA